MGPNLACLLKAYWGRQSIVPNMGKFLGKAFWVGKGVMQGNPASPMIFNIVVDEVVPEVLDVVCGTQEAQHDLVWVAGERNVIFYADNGRIAGWDNKWVKYALSVMV